MKNEVQGKKSLKDRLPSAKKTLTAAGIAAVAGGIALGLKRARRPLAAFEPLNDGEYSGAPEGGDRVHEDA